MAHMLSLLLSSVMAICALKWPPDSSQDTETTAQIAAVKEKQFNAAYLEIELVGEPGRLVKVLLSYWTSYSVFSISKRSLQGMYHKLVRHPPKFESQARCGKRRQCRDGRRDNSPEISIPWLLLYIRAQCLVASHGHVMHTTPSPGFVSDPPYAALYSPHCNDFTRVRNTHIL